MSKFKDEINKELSFLNTTDSAQDIISKTEHKNKIITFKRAVAMVATLVLVFTIIFIPKSNAKTSFVIVANAQATADSSTADENTATGDELNTESFVELMSSEPNYIFYNFNYILDENAEDTDLTRKYLFHSFNKQLNISVEGDDIETITYKINNGSLSSCTFEEINNSSKQFRMGNTNGNSQSEITIPYNKQKDTYFDFNPSISTNNFHNTEKNYFVMDTGVLSVESGDVVYSESGEVLAYYPKSIIGYGYRDDETLATDEEIETLREYAKNNDMIGFYNYQNQIFKRLIDGITLDISVTKSNGETITQTVEFLYTPDVIETLPSTTDAIEKNQTLSTGSLSARIKK